MTEFLVGCCLCSLGFSFYLHRRLEKMAERCENAVIMAMKQVEDAERAAGAIQQAYLACNEIAGDCEQAANILVDLMNKQTTNENPDDSQDWSHPDKWD